MITAHFHNSNTQFKQMSMLSSKTKFPMGGKKRDSKQTFACFWVESLLYKTMYKLYACEIKLHFYGMNLPYKRDTLSIKNCLHQQCTPR